MSGTTETGFDYLEWEDINPGDVLPELVFPITVKTLALAVVGTRDMMPYHHDSEYAKATGNRDMFVNTMFDQALFARFVTDWCGPESDFRETSLNMVGQLCPGDTAVVRGKVSEKYEADGEYRAKLELAVSSREHGMAATSTAVIAMPSKAGGPVKPLLELAKPVIEPHPEMPDFAREWLGKTSDPGWGAYPISETGIFSWCDMVEDANPNYENGDYARSSRHGGIIAPPMGLITWNMQRSGRQGVNPAFPDVGCDSRAAWPPTTQTKHKIMNPPDTSDIIAQGSIQAYGKPLRPGDRTYCVTELVNCSPKKNTRLGPGYFQTNLDTYYNQDDEIVGTNLFVLLRY